ncbi:MAG: DUF2269 family protein [Chloroflexi bacterium]|nr:DUF2269 family protein [Chloroflexota bacterium]MDA1003327.1 DUF2269 family protein [Chloroflexota bacterium]
MSRYETLLFLHLLGVFFLVGAAGISTAAGVATGRITRVRTSAFLLDLQHRVEWFVTLPAAVLVLFAGLLLVDAAGYSLSDGWISGAIVLLLLALVLDFGGLVPRNRRTRRVAEQMLTDGIEVGEDVQKAAAAPLTMAMGVGLDLIFVIFLWLMVVKPGS